MKNILLILVLLLGATTAPAQLIKPKAPIDAKYLAGAVPEENGKVVFSREIEIPASVNADSVNLLMNRWIGKYYNQSKVLKRVKESDDSDKYYHEVGIVQYITFKSTAFVLDRTQIIYRLSVRQQGRKLLLRMTDISYYYNEESNPEKFTAEELITDEAALKHNKKDLVRKIAKFRIKTIDTFDEISHDMIRFVNSI
ncbi:MAG: DUF4468 domain-containing protein [Bacteroidales bacterium]|nr:DUF4468 domain-containing protein [Bacteroidales bacterium]